jgi:ATP-dependent Clp protease ATP-binding subunit ClpA
MGPTGVGKTETAKQLAKQLGVKLIRFDMSEYQEKHSVAKLIGSPPGYVGFEENSGLLITKVQENPNCVLLLDEVEKSHPDVSSLLLQIMDNGFVTGSNGKTADCRNVVLILTTNLGAAEAETNTVGFGEMEKDLDDGELKKFFAPEFRNRLDGIMTFGKLDKNTMIKIVGKFLVDLKVMLTDKGVETTISDEAIDFLIDKGFDSKMGARPLQRVIDNDIKTPLSKVLLFGDLKNGGTLHINVKDGAFDLQTVKSKSKEPETVDQN